MSHDTPAASPGGLSPVSNCLHVYHVYALYKVNELSGCHGARESQQLSSLGLACRPYQPDISEWGEKWTLENKQMLD